MSIPYPTNDKSFLGLVVVEITNANHKAACDVPSLAEWAGIKDGERFTCESYTDGSLWAQLGRDYSSEEFGEATSKDWFELSMKECRVVEA